MQLRLGFSAPSKAQSMHLVLSGLSVLVEPDDGNYDLACEYLVSAGVPATMDVGKGLNFMVKHITFLGALPEHVHVTGDELLAPLLDLVFHPAADSLPATLTLSYENTLRLSWFDGNLNHDEVFLPQASSALLSSELSFVATSETWDELKIHCRLPFMAGRARANLDGYIEIATTKPQLVETSPLPALFRIDDTHFGLPLAYADAISSDHSFVWEGHKPVIDSGPEELPSTPLILSGHSEADLKEVVGAIAAQRAGVLAWDSGLGRRVFSLAATVALDAFPLLIICPPSAVWAWQRHLDLFGKSYALTHDRNDVHIVTYRDLVSRTSITSPGAIIFDGLSDALAYSEETKQALHRLDGILDAYRIACDSDFPTKLEEALECLSILRPGEFRADIPAMQRYPVHTDKRAREHIEAYLSRKRRQDTPPPPPGINFKRSSVVSLVPSDAQVIAFEQALAHPRNPLDTLSELLQIASAGPSHSPSPKVAAAAGRVRKAKQEGRSIAVLTRHSRTSQLLKALLRPLEVKSHEGAGIIEPVGAATIIRFDSELPILDKFDEVVVIDYPWSTHALEESTGSAAEPGLPQHAVVLHLEDSIDDRLAMLAARRREWSSVTDGTAPPTAEELTFLLSPRD